MLKAAATLSGTGTLTAVGVLGSARSVEPDTEGGAAAADVPFLLQTLVEQFKELLDTVGKDEGRLSASDVNNLLAALGLLVALLAYFRPAG